MKSRIIDKVRGYTARIIYLSGSKERFVTRYVDFYALGRAVSSLKPYPSSWADKRIIISLGCGAWRIVRRKICCRAKRARDRDGDRAFDTGWPIDRSRVEWSIVKVASCQGTWDKNRDERARKKEDRKTRGPKIKAERNESGGGSFFIPFHYFGAPWEFGSGRPLRLAKGLEKYAILPFFPRWKTHETV